MPKISVRAARGSHGFGAAAAGCQLRARSRRRTVGEQLAGIVLRSMSTAPAGLIVANRRDARSAERCRGAPPGMQVAQQAVQPVDARRALGGQLIAAIREQPQHGVVVIRPATRAEVVAVLGDERDAARRRCRRSCVRGRFGALGCGRPAPTGRRRRSRRRRRSCWASSRPRPPAPSIGPEALRASQPAHARTPGERRLVGQEHATRASGLPVSSKRDGGVGALVGVDPDRDHWRCFPRG